jgi:PAS domain S-box-containing protein
VRELIRLSALILEDWKPDFDLIANQLRCAGFDARCHQAESMEEYLVQLDAEPDIVLADYALPGFDALHALELLKARGLDIPFVVLTGVVDEEALVECMRQGAVDYLLKDRLARLGPAVHRALQESEVRRKKRVAEAALRNSNRRFQYLVETTGAIPWEMDAETGQFTYVGPQAVKLLGYPVEEWYGAGFWDAHVHPEDRGALADQPSQSCERICRMRTRQGSMVYLHCAISEPCPDTNGNHKTLYGFMMDVTEMKSMQDSLASQAAALATSNEELKQFAYAASHDLQEPLRMVAFYTQLLAKRYLGKLDSDADEFIGYALEGAIRMRALVKHLLTYSRVSTGKPSMASTNCEEVLAESLANLRLALSESGASVTHEPLPTVNADALQLSQLFQNLIGNAIKFRGDKPPVIRISAAEEDSDWRFTVQDNGIGIEAQYFEQIFVIFQRLNSSEQYAGSGVGLALCKRIMEHHGGRIWVQSEPGAGTKFHFTIPKEHQCHF